MNRQQNFKKNPHTARFLSTFHAGTGADLPAEITADGRKLDSDGNEWIAAEERAALAFLNEDTYVTPEQAPTAPQRVITGPVRPMAGYLADFQGHKVRCGEGFITEAQAKWIVDILLTREVTGADETFIRLEQGFAKFAGSQFITANKNAPKKALPVNPAKAEASTEELEADAVPAGRYALRTDGVVKFYQLDRPTQGRWAGYVFLKAQASDDTYPIRNREHKALILAEIAQDLLGAEQLYGQELGRCARCARTLTDETSRAYGIGPECRKK